MRLDMIRKHPFRASLLVALVAGVLGYVFAGVDLIPDSIVFFGFLDDAFVIVLSLVLASTYLKLGFLLGRRNRR